MYADKRTEAIVGALEETNRRRGYQVAYNEEHGITPETIVKGVSDISELLSLEPRTCRRRVVVGKAEVEGMSRDELEKLVITLEEEMYLAAEELRFEYGGEARDDQGAQARAAGVRGVDDLGGNHVPEHQDAAQLRAAGDRGGRPGGRAQYVRKVSGSYKPSQANEVAFGHAVDEVAVKATTKLLAALSPRGAPRDREFEAARARGPGPRSGFGRAA